jgi:hypothetical protein
MGRGMGRNQTPFRPGTSPSIPMRAGRGAGGLDGYMRNVGASLRQDVGQMGNAWANTVFQSQHPGWLGAAMGGALGAYGGLNQAAGAFSAEEAQRKSKLNKRQIEVLEKYLGEDSQ